MLDPEYRSDRRAVETAIAGFARRLVVASLAERVARLETRLHGSTSPDDLFAAEAAMAASWPRPHTPPPVHELVWATGADGLAAAAGVEIRALDSSGRVLLVVRDPAGTDPKSAKGVAHE